MRSLQRILFWVSLVALTTASLLPIEQLPPQVFSVWDKAQHALGFGWLMLFGLLGYPQHHGKLAAALVAWGAAVELMQAATGWRYGEWADLLADAVGILVVWAVWKWGVARAQ